MWTSSVSVHPWVGENFLMPKYFSHRTLILGESNYTKPENFGVDLVKKCVQNDISTDIFEVRDTTGFCRFSTKTRRIIFGSNETIGPKEFWQDVAYYNFIQSRVGDTARIRPTQEMWTDSIPAFNEIVSNLNPSRILVLGKANWINLLKHIDHEIVDPFIVKINISSVNITMGYINHPSSSLSYSVWQPIARRILFS